MKHEIALKRLIESAFPVSTIKYIAVNSPRVGTEADILYNLSPTATMGGADTSATVPQVSVFNVTKSVGNSVQHYDANVLPFYSTGTLLGDCASYCTIGYDPSTSDGRPLPLMAPRLHPRRMCLDAVVLVPGYEAKDLKRIVAANLVKQLPRLSGEMKSTTKEKLYVKQHKLNDVTNFEDIGLRILSDCIEMVVDTDPPKELLYANTPIGPADPTYKGRRTMFVGFANSAWSTTMLNRSLSDEERGPRRVLCGQSRETLRRALPKPIIDASRLLTNYSKSVCAGTRMELPATFWLNAAMVAASNKTHDADTVIAEGVMSALQTEGKPPPRSLWEQDSYNRAMSWEHLCARRPITSLQCPFHFELISSPEKNLIIGAGLAQTTIRVLSSISVYQEALLPVEHFNHPAFKAALRHVISASRRSPPNFLSSIGGNSE